jgi:hypothetical protein
VDKSLVDEKGLLNNYIILIEKKEKQILQLENDIKKIDEVIEKKTAESNKLIAKVEYIMGKIVKVED